MFNSSPARRLASVAAVFAFLLAAVPAIGQAMPETRKFTASDGASDDNFGGAVAIDGTTAVVGASDDDDAASRSGSAYLFDTVTGVQRFKLNASDPIAFAGFGSAVAVSGSIAMVGAPGGQGAFSGQGTAYLFSTVTGIELHRLVAPLGDPVDEFANSVAISGTVAVVGARGDSHAGSNAGSAYVIDAVTGQIRFRLTAPDAALGDMFGTSVAVSGTIVVVGAPLSDPFGSASGSVYAFDATTGQFLFKLIPDDARTAQHFGASVAISGTTILVGAPGDNHAGRSTGAAYLFDATTGLQLHRLVAPDGAEFDEFGSAVSLSGTTAIIGAPRDADNGPNSGSAYLFDTRTGAALAKLNPSDAGATDGFGNSVAISGTTAIAGAPYDDDRGSNAGAAHLFRTAGPVLIQPSGLVVEPGETAEFELRLIDPVGVTYQWRRNGVALADAGHISGSSTPVLRIVAGPDDVALYDCVFARSYGPDRSSDAAALAVLPDPNACYPDANGDGVLDFFDISRFIIEFGRGCP